MTIPESLPQRAPAPPRRPRRFLGFMLLLLLLASVGLGGYFLGQRTAPLPLWDELWFRAYTNRPLDRSAPGDGFWVTGYYVDYDRSSLESVKLNAGHMDQVVIFGYGFDRQGNVQGKEQHLVRGITAQAKRILLFGNLTNGAFDRETAHAILTDRAVQDRAILGILEKADQLGVAGVQIDFENIADGDREAYTAFLRRLKEMLRSRNMSLSIAAAAKTADTRTGWGGATDYAAIGQIVDHFYIMAYDEHWRGGEPGPVASLGWVEKVIRYATGVMPAQKIILGVPFYGYDWTAEPGKGTGTNKAYGAAAMARRMEQLGARVIWDPVAGENKATFRTADGDRIAWYPDERSLDAKLRLAYQYNLKGIAIWRVGFEPDEWWHRLGGFRLKPEK
ncbi:MAG: glycosyl hydrolase family 18 protein [Bacillota bacterium]